MLILLPEGGGQCLFGDGGGDPNLFGFQALSSQSARSQGLRFVGEQEEVCRGQIRHIEH